MSVIRLLKKDNNNLKNKNMKRAFLVIREFSYTSAIRSLLIEPFGIKQLNLNDYEKYN